MHMKKNLCIALLCVLLTQGLLTGCGGDTATTETAAPETTADTAAPETETELTDGLPDMHFNGQSFVISIYENPDARNHVFSHEQDGSAINDAIYTATIATEERFDVVLEELVDPSSLNGAGNGGQMTYFQKPILAGDDAFQVANVRCPDALVMYTDGLLQTYDVLPHINLEQPWWSKANKDLTIEGVTYTAIGDMALNAYDLTHVLLFNQQMLTDFNLTSPFTLIAENNWTLDEMVSMMQTVTVDLNGDGAMDATDQYGYASYARVSAQNFWIAGGNKTLVKDADDRYSLHLQNEALIEYMIKITDILWGEKLAWFEDAKGYYAAMPDWEIEMFTSNRVLFANSTLRFMEMLRDMEADFGIVPYPKRDTSQEDYYVRLGYYNAPVIPVTNAAVEMTGALLEALNFQYYKVVRPAYFEVSLKGKIARDPESVAMLDLVLDSRTIDVGDVLFAGTIRETLAGQFLAGKTDYASAISANQKKNEQALQNAIPANE